MEVTFYNIGQGNATIITCPKQKTMLVDAGSSSAPLDDDKCTQAITSMVKNIIAKSPTKELFVVASHADKDHINKISQVCQQLLQKKFTLSFLLGGSKANYEKTVPGKQLLGFIDTNSKKCSLKFAADVTGTGTQRFKEFKKIVPSYCTVLSALIDQKDGNDNSLVLKVSDENLSALLPGDATGEATDEILADITRRYLMKADGFEVSHHGADTHNCTSLKLLLAVNPKNIFISAGLYKGYNHPRFDVIKTIVEFCIIKKLTDAPHHMITYHPPQGVHPFTGKTDKTRFNLIAINDDEFGIAQTSLPIYNTVDTGTITYNQQGITANNTRNAHEQRGLGALQGIQTPRFDGIRFLFFNNMKIESRQLKQYLTTLPRALEYMDLRNNNIGHFGIEHLITLYKNHGNHLIVKLADNRLVDKKALTTVCKKKDMRAITTKNRIIATFTKKGRAQDTVESLVLSRGHSGNSPLQHAQAKDFAQDSSKDLEDAFKNKLERVTDDQELVYELSHDTKNLYFEHSDQSQEGFSYEWPDITDICLLYDQHQTVAGITTKNCSSLFDFVKNEFKDLTGRFRYTNASKPWKTIGKEFWSLDEPGTSYFHERTPFSTNGKFVMTVCEKNKEIHIYQTDPLVFDAHHVESHKSISEDDLKKDLGHSIADIKRVEFCDGDNSVRCHFTDKTNGELRYILEPNEI
jgi:beta-lactamase superfamily II metal-dependent hydrolase